MKTKSIALSYAAVLGSVFTLAGTAGAVLTETDSFQQGDGVNPFTPTFAAPAGDFLLGLAPTTIAPNEASFTLEGAGGTPVLTDGGFSPIFTGGSGPHPSFATGGGSSGGTQLIYTFAPVTLNSVVTLGGWNDGGRDTQAYTVSYRVGGVITSLATVNYDPSPGNGTGVQIATQVVLNGFSVANVDQLIFNFATAENGHQGYAELAATAAPEPTTMALGLMSGLGMLGIRRRRR